MSVPNPNQPRLRGQSPQPRGNMFGDIAQRFAGQMAPQPNASGTPTNTGPRQLGYGFAQQLQGAFQGMGTQGWNPQQNYNFGTERNPRTRQMLHAQRQQRAAQPQRQVQQVIPLGSHTTTAQVEAARLKQMGYASNPQELAQMYQAKTGRALPTEYRPVAPSPQPGSTGYGAPTILEDGTRLYNQQLAQQAANPTPWQSQLWNNPNLYGLTSIADEWANHYAGQGQGPNGLLTQADWDAYLSRLASQGYITQQGANWVPTSQYYQDQFGWLNRGGQLYNTGVLSPQQIQQLMANGATQTPNYGFVVGGQ